MLPIHRRVLFVFCITVFFATSVFLAYFAEVDFPSTGISIRTLNLVISTIRRIGYVGIFILMTLESCGVPIPSEIIMPFSGYLVYLGYMNFWMVVLVGSLANLAGSVLAYWIGLRGRSFLDRYGKYLLIRKHHLEFAERLFERYGSLIVFLGRNMPVVRTYISFPAGISRMNFVKFCVLTFLGSIPWNIFLTYLGIVLGERWSSVVTFFEKLDVIIILTGIVTVIYLLFFEASE